MQCTAWYVSRDVCLNGISSRVEAAKLSQLGNPTCGPEERKTKLRAVLLIAEFIQVRPHP